MISESELIIYLNIKYNFIIIFIRCMKMDMCTYVCCMASIMVCMVGGSCMEVGLSSWHEIAFRLPGH